MAQLSSRLVISLVDKFTGPSRAINSALVNMRDRMERNNRAMHAARGQLFDAAAMGYALVRGLSAPIRAASGFEAAMNRVEAVSGASAEKMEALRLQARELGRSTQFRASEAAGAQGFLAMAGFSPEKILSAMPGTLQLAAAANMDLAQSADIVSNVLTGYRFEAEQLGRVNDVLVKAFTSANTNLSQLGVAMKYAGPVASSAGMEFETAAAVIGLMGNAGIQGSMAGTSLRNSISRLLSPTPKMTKAMNKAGISVVDANGRLKDFTDIVRQLEPHVENTGLFMEIFGQRAGPAMAAVVSQGAEALEELEQSLIDSGGTAERISKTQMKGFQGRMKEFASVMEDMLISLGKALLPVMTKIVKAIMPVVGAISRWIEANPALASGILTVVSALVALRVAAVAARFAFLWMNGAALAGMITGLSAAARSMNLLAAAMLPFRSMGRGIASAFGAARNALVGFAGAASVIGTWGAVATVLGGMRRGLWRLITPTWAAAGSFAALKAATAFLVIGAPLALGVAALAAAGLAIAQNWDGIKAMFSGIADALGESFPNAMQKVTAAFEKITSFFSQFSLKIDKSKEEWHALGVSIGKSLADGIKAIDQALKDITTAITKIATDIVNAFAEIPAKIVDLFTGLGAKITEAIGSIVPDISFSDWIGGEDKKGLPAGIELHEIPKLTVHPLDARAAAGPSVQEAPSQPQIPNNAFIPSIPTPSPETEARLDRIFVLVNKIAALQQQGLPSGDLQPQLGDLMAGYDDMLKYQIERVIRLLADGGQEARAAAQQMAAGIRDAMRAADEAMAGAAGDAALDGGALHDQLGQVKTAAVNAGQEGGSGLRSGIASGMSGAVSAAQTGVAQIIAAFSGLSARLFASGATAVAQFAAGMRSNFGVIRAASAEMAQIVKNHVPASPVKVGPLRNLPESGAKIVEQLASGMRPHRAALAASAVAAAVFANLPTSPMSQVDAMFGHLDPTNRGAQAFQGQGFSVARGGQGGPSIVVNIAAPNIQVSGIQDPAKAAEEVSRRISSEVALSIESALGDVVT